MEFWLHTVLLLAASAVAVLGRPEGAPEAACSDFIPNHSNPANQAVGDVPYYVNTSAIGNSYAPNYTYTIILSGTTNNSDFRGFLIQARVVADDSPTGEFMFDSETDQQSRCVMNTGATHTGRADKTTVMLRWTSPSDGTGAIYFRYAFVDIYNPGTSNVFWANLTTAMITEASTSVGNDPHFFLPLPNGDNLCFSVQGQPDFMFSLIKDRYVQLNTQFVLPAEDESHTIANVSTFLGNLGLVLRSPVTGNTTAIKVSATDHTVLVDGSIITVKDKPVTVLVSNTFIVDITVDVNQQVHTIKDGSAWLYINTEFGFGIKVRFYKQHLDLFLTKTSGLTCEVHGIIGQFLNSNIEVDDENNLLKFGNRKPISVRRGPAWPYLHINEECWYGTATDNQGTGVIEGNYMDYVVQELIP